MVGGQMRIVLCLTIILSLFTGEAWAEEYETQGPNPTL
jgi:hypothetical protein